MFSGVTGLRDLISGADTLEADAALVLVLECLVGARAYLRGLAKVKPKGRR